MLRWICGHTRRDRIRNDDNQEKLDIVLIQEKLVRHRLRWFDHIQQSPPKAPIHNDILSRSENIRRSRSIWEETIKRDFKE
jgi:hypothetical protein